MPRWTEHTRQQQRERILHQRPWLESTGPVTSYGKQVASRNASKKKQPVSQELHSGFTPGCENAAESDTDRRLEIYDRVCYIGGFAPTMLACGDSPLEVVGFCQLGTGAIACRSAGGKLIWIYPQDLERVNAPMDTGITKAAIRVNSQLAALDAIDGPQDGTGQKGEL